MNIKDPVIAFAYNLISLHHDIMWYIIIILTLVYWSLYKIIKEYSWNVPKIPVPKIPNKQISNKQGNYKIKILLFIKKILRFKIFLIILINCILFIKLFSIILNNNFSNVYLNILLNNVYIQLIIIFILVFLIFFLLYKYKKYLGVLWLTFITKYYYWSITNYNKNSDTFNFLRYNKGTYEEYFEVIDNPVKNDWWNFIESNWKYILIGVIVVSIFIIGYIYNQNNGSNDSSNNINNNNNSNNSNINELNTSVSDINIEANVDSNKISTEDLNVDSTEDLNVDSIEDSNIKLNVNSNEIPTEDLNVDSIEDSNIKLNINSNEISTEDLNVDSIEDSNIKLNINSNEISTEDLNVDSIEDSNIKSNVDNLDQILEDTLNEVENPIAKNPIASSADLNEVLEEALVELDVIEERVKNEPKDPLIEKTEKDLNELANATNNLNKKIKANEDLLHDESLKSINDGVSNQIDFLKNWLRTLKKETDNVVAENAIRMNAIEQIEAERVQLEADEDLSLEQSAESVGEDLPLELEPPTSISEFVINKGIALLKDK